MRSTGPSRCSRVGVERCLGDKGFISQELANTLREKGVELNFVMHTLAALVTYCLKPNKPGLRLFPSSGKQHGLSQEFITVHTAAAWDVRVLFQVAQGGARLASQLHVVP